MEIAVRPQSTHSQPLASNFPLALTMLKLRLSIMHTVGIHRGKDETSLIYNVASRLRMVALL